MPRSARALSLSLWRNQIWSSGPMISCLDGNLGYDFSY
jgi:hypothetical protein